MSFYAQQHTSGIQVEHTRHKMRFTLDSIRSHQKIGSMLIESFKLLFSKGHPRIRDIVFFFRLNDENVTLSAQMLWLDMFAKSDWTPFVAIFFLFCLVFFHLIVFFLNFHSITLYWVSLFPIHLLFQNSSSFGKLQFPRVISMEKFHC